MTLPELETHTVYDGWTIHLTRLFAVGPELFDAPTRTVLVDPTLSSPALAITHAISHLRHGHQWADEAVFTEEMCMAADADAADMLALEGDWTRALQPRV